MVRFTTRSTNRLRKLTRRRPTSQDGNRHHQCWRQTFTLLRIRVAGFPSTSAKNPVTMLSRRPDAITSRTHRTRTGSSGSIVRYEKLPQSFCSILTRRSGVCESASAAPHREKVCPTSRHRGISSVATGGDRRRWWFPPLTPSFVLVWSLLVDLYFLLHETSPFRDSRFRFLEVSHVLLEIPRSHSSSVIEIRDRAFEHEKTPRRSGRRMYSSGY